MSIIWLVSYPKSGNTWMRVFLSNYLRNGDEAAHINHLEKMDIASDCGLFQRYAGVDPSELTLDEIDAARPDVYQLLAQENHETEFIKVHDAYTLLPNGRPLFPSEGTQGAIYIVRNPLDVAVSMRHHSDDPDLNWTIQRMANPEETLGASAQRHQQCRQRLLTWSRHVCSWLDTPKPFPVHLVCYEQMHQEPDKIFAQVVTFTGLPLEQKRLTKAIHFSQFKTLQQQEAVQGFRECVRPETVFFRRGQIGDWRNHLSPLQIKTILTAHKDVMDRLGYVAELTPS